MVSDCKAITDLGELRDIAAQLLEEGKCVAVDTETGYRGPDFTSRATDHSHPDQFCVGFSFSNDPTWGRYVPLHHDEGTNISDADKAWDAVRDLFTKGNLVSHNAKFEARVFEKAAGIKLASEGNIIDTMLCVYVLNKWSENGMRPLMDLKGLVARLCGHKMMHIHELWPDLAANKNSKIRFNTLNADNPLVVSYACEDAVWVLPLKDIVYPLAVKERPFMLQLEHRIMQLMVDVETYGVAIDWDAMETSYAQAQTFVPNMETWVKQGLSDLSGRDVSELNLRSTVQMKQLLYRDIGLETTRMTKAGKDAADKQDWERMSTDEKAMTALSREHPEIRNLLSYREVQNLNQRLKKWTTEYNQASDRRVHANYNQVTVGSGRFAAKEPAIQQLPKKWYWSTVTPENETVNGDNYWKGNFRDFVVAAPGNYLLTFDLSQAELRMLAGDSQEPALLNAFANDIDVHTITASQMLGKPIESISSEDRAIGKTFNFALLYGMGTKAMAEQLGIQPHEAEDLYQKYFAAFSNVEAWMAKTVKVGREKGYAETIFGRGYTVWELTNQQRWIQDKGDRVLVNARIQGGVADMMKIGMLRAQAMLKREGLWMNGCTITMNQHDALTFEVRNDIDPNWLQAKLEPLVSFDSKTHPALKGYPNFRSDWELGQKWGSSTKWDKGIVAKFVDEQWTIPAQDGIIEPMEEFIELDVSNGILSNQMLELSNLIKAHPGNTTVEFVYAPDKRITVPIKTSATKEQLMEALV